MVVESSMSFPEGFCSGAACCELATLPQKKMTAIAGSSARIRMMGPCIAVCAARSRWLLADFAEGCFDIASNASEQRQRKCVSAQEKIGTLRDTGKLRIQ
jgi:hypothetical protein